MDRGPAQTAGGGDAATASRAAASGQTMVQELFPNRLRGQASALLVLFVGILGAGCGPLLVSLISGSLFAQANLAQAMVCVALPGAVAIVALYLAARPAYQATVERLQRTVPPRGAAQDAMSVGETGLA